MSAAALRGVSRESLAGARDTLGTLIRSGATDLTELGDDLFHATEVLDRELTLRRALTDPARSGDDRAELARAVFGERLGSSATDLLVWSVRSGWSGPRDLADGVEVLATEAVVAAADRASRLDRVEDELFRIGRIVAGAPQLRATMSDPSVPADRRAELIGELVGGRVADETLRLVRQAVLAPRGRTFDDSVISYGQVAADLRSRMVATVTAAVPLTEAQRDRLGAALTRLYGHDIHLNVQVGRELVGGIRVEIGDEIIDGSVVSRLDEARRRLSG